MANMDERLEGMRFVIESKLEDVIVLSQIVATEVVRAKPKNEYWHVYNYLEALLKARQCKEAVEKKLLLESKDCGTQVQRDSGTSPEPDHDKLTEEDLAAIKIQKAYRAHKRMSIYQQNEVDDLQGGELPKEQELTEEEVAAIKIQKAYRLHRSKSMQVGELEDNFELLSPQQENLEEEEEAAIKIQKAFRAKRSQSMQKAELLKQEEEGAVAMKIQQAFRRWSRTSDLNEDSLENIEEELEAGVSPSKQHTKKKSSHGNFNLLTFMSDIRGRRRTVAAVESHQMTSPLATRDTFSRRKSWAEGGKQLINTLSPQTLKTTLADTKARFDCAYQNDLPKTHSPSPYTSVKKMGSQPQVSIISEADINILPSKNNIQSSQEYENKFLSPKSRMSNLNNCLHVGHIHGFSTSEDGAHTKQKKMKEYSKTVEKLNLSDKKKRNSETPAAPPSSPRSTKDGKE